MDSGTWSQTSHVGSAFEICLAVCRERWANLVHHRRKHVVLSVDHPHKKLSNIILRRKQSSDILRSESFFRRALYSLPMIVSDFSAS